MNNFKRTFLPTFLFFKVWSWFFACRIEFRFLYTIFWQIACTQCTMFMNLSPRTKYQLSTLKSLINKQGGYVVFLVLCKYLFIRNLRVINEYSVKTKNTTQPSCLYIRDSRVAWKTKKVRRSVCSVHTLFFIKGLKKTYEKNSSPHTKYWLSSLKNKKVGNSVCKVHWRHPICPKIVYKNVYEIFIQSHTPKLSSLPWKTKQKSWKNSAQCAL